MTDAHWIVVGARLSDLPDPGTPGSRVERCAACGARLWTSPSTERSIAAQKPASVTYRCVDCARPQLPSIPLADRRVAPGAFDEAVAATGDPGRIRDVVEILTGKRPSDD